MKITVIGYEESDRSNVLIYAVDVADPQNETEVQAAVQAERNKDVDDEYNEMTILFAFAGDLMPLADWRT